MNRRYLLFLPWLAAALVGGCATSQRPNLLSGTIGDWYSVTADQTAFYHYGPQQGNGPDKQLEKKSLMKVIRPSFGYVKVQLVTGEDGYVASEDIRPASAALVAEQLAPPPTPPPVLAQRSEEFRFNSDDPRLIAPPEPLPEPSATPAFHY